MEKELNIKVAKDIIYIEIKKYRLKKESIKEIESKISMLKDVMFIISQDLDILNNNILGIDYLLEGSLSEQESRKYYKVITDYLYAKKYSNDEKYILQNEKKFLNLMQILNESLELLEIEKDKISIELDENKEKVIKYKLMFKLIMNNGFLNTNLIDDFKKLMESYGYDNKQIVKTLEMLNINFIKSRNKGIPNYTVINMLDKEFEKIEISEIEEYIYSKSQMPLINSLYESLLKNGFDETLSTLPRHTDNYITLEEFDYIFKKIINKLTEDLIESCNDISNIEMYKELKIPLIEQYNRTLDLYLIIKRYYNEEKEAFLKKNASDEEVEIVNELLYLYRENSQYSYIEKDIKNISEEFYYDVLKLLNNLKQNKLNYKNTKKFNGNNKLKKFLELRDDQLRILCRRVVNNQYAIIGIFQKQDDNDLNNYLKIAGRYIDAINLGELQEKSQETEERLYTFLQENMRKGSR